MASRTVSNSVTHAAAVTARLRALGADYYDLKLPESHILPHLLTDDEKILGVLFGKYVFNQANGQVLVGRGLLVATDRRILFIDKKPLYLYFDEIIYDVVSGIMKSQILIGNTTTLSTRMGDIHIRSYNQRCANTFLKSIEEKLFNHRQEA